MVRGTNEMLVQRSGRASPARLKEQQQQDRTMGELKLASMVLRTVVVLRRLLCWTWVIAFALSAEQRHC